MRRAAGIGGERRGLRPNTAHEPTDEARIQEFLDTRYTARDVRHSFKTKLGEAIDCIDFFAQPGVKALAARGTPITEMPNFEIPADVQARLDAKPPAKDDPAFDGAPDEDGNARACPDATVPTLRVTREQIQRAGGLDAYRHRAARKVPPKAEAPGLPEFQGYGHVQTSFDGVYATAGISSMTIATPQLPGNAVAELDYSLVQTWTYSGTEMGPGCGTNCFQTVEAGWDVDPYQFKDDNPHLFIFGTPDGYVTGCYDDDESTGTCMPWIAIPGAKFTLGQAVTASTPGGATSELTVYTANSAPGAWPGWVITVGVGSTLTVLGYYPITDFGSGSMATAATTFQVGGEVYDGVAYSTGAWTDPAGVRMGMGGLGGDSTADQGYSYTAVQHDYEYTNGSAWISSAPAPITTRTGSYTWSQSLPGGSSSWKDYFYFGDVIPACVINGVNYYAGQPEKGSKNGCFVCVPSVSTTSWSLCSNEGLVCRTIHGSSSCVAP